MGIFVFQNVLTHQKKRKSISSETKPSMIPLAKIPNTTLSIQETPLLPRLIKPLSILILLSGIGIRVFRFWENRCLEGDEAALALNFADRTFRGLLAGPLSHNQHAPIGFLTAVELSTSIFGMGEQALRLIPLVSGLAALYAFHILAKKTLSPWLAVAALMCFSFNRDLIYYSVTLKQYETEVLMAVLLCIAYMEWADSLRSYNLLAWGLAGGIAVWFSYSCIFILAATGLAAAIEPMRTRQWKHLAKLAAVYGFWLLNFGFIYSLSIKASTSSNWLAKFWQDKQAFAPLPVSLDGVAWFLTASFKFVSHPLSLKNNLHPALDYKLNIIVVLLLLAGSALMLVKKPKFFFSFSLPFLFTVLASGLRVYPFSGRLLLFLIPLCLIVIFFGIHFFLDFFSKKIPKTRYAVWLVGGFMVVFLFMPSLANSLDNSLYESSQSREAFAFVNARRKPDEMVYIHPFLSVPYLYYQKTSGYGWKLAVATSPYGQARSLERYKAAIKNDFLKTESEHRFWIVTSNLYDVALAASADDVFVSRLRLSEESVILEAAGSSGSPVQRMGRFGPESVFLKTGE